MTAAENWRDYVLRRPAYGPRRVYEEAVDTISAAARLVLYDDLRPGQIHGRTEGTNQWIVHERDFALYLPLTQEASVKAPWGFVSTHVVHRERGDRNQFALDLRTLGITLKWNNSGDKVLHRVKDEPDTYLLPQAIFDVAELLVSPMFVNHDPETGEFEYQMTPPYADRRSLFPVGGIEEAVVAYTGIASFICDLL